MGNPLEHCFLLPCLSCVCILSICMLISMLITVNTHTNALILLLRACVHTCIQISMHKKTFQMDKKAGRKHAYSTQ